MSETVITATMKDDGTLLKHLPDGTEEEFTIGQIKSMSDAELEAAMSDTENPPITEESQKHLRPVPRVKTLRRALGLTQEQFADRYHIPLGTLRDWEQGRSQPDQSAFTLLDAIAEAPEEMAKIIARRPRVKRHQENRGKIMRV